MKTYFYTQTESCERGYNICISLYRVKHNVPDFISSSNHNSASWKGASGQAGELLHKIHPATKFDGYQLTSNSLQMFDIDGGPADQVRKVIA